MKKIKRSNTYAPFRQLIQFREKLLVGVVEWTKPWYALWFKKSREAWQHSRQSLLRFPPKTLGHDLGTFLQSQNLDLLPKMEDHDVMHVLFRFKTTVADEARMQFFLLGNGKRSIYAAFTAITALFLLPEHCRAFRQSFLRGKACINISKWKFEFMLAEPTAALRQLINNKGLGVEAPLLF